MTLQTYIAEGFMEDCEELIYRLTEKFQRVDWHKFCYYWKEMEFDILFYGRQSGPEVVEFTEELLQTARLYIVTETDNIENQVVGLFIAYAITIIQPYKNLCSLRLGPKDVKALKKIEALARQQNRRDVLMILGKMYICGKTQFHVSIRERAMDITIRKYFDGSTNVPPCIARRWHGRLDRLRVDALEDIAQIESRYMDLKMKAKLEAEATFPGSNVEVDMFKPEAKHMAESLRKLIAGETDTKDDGESYVSTVKKKAMKNIVDPMKHLQGLAERQKKEETKEKPADTPKPSTTKSKSKSKSKNKSGKLSSPQRTEEPLFGFSLPSLDDPSGGNLNREGSPEAPFRGFSIEDIENCEYKKNSQHRTKKTTNECSKGKSIDKIKPTDTTTIPEKRKKNKGRSPAHTATKRKNINNDQDTSKKKKRKYKNKLNKKLRLKDDFNSDDSNTLSSNYTSDEADEVYTIPTLKDNENPLPNIDTATCKGKELTIQTRGVIKHFTEYEVSDIVIRTERDAPSKDIEIEYIDNYTGANAYEELCEVSDDEDLKERKKGNDVIDLEKDSDEVKITIEECDEFGSTRHGNIEFQIVTEDASKTYGSKMKPNENREDLEDIIARNEKDNEAVKIILSKNQPRIMERRRLKQPNLRSKLKKMGLLPVANFEDDTN